MSEVVDSSVVVDSIGQNLRRIRVRQQLSIADLASRSGVAKATLANLERGRGNPTIETLWALTRGLHVAFSDLLEHPDPVVIRVVRSGEGARIESASTGNDHLPVLDLHLLDRLESSSLTEVYEFEIPKGGYHKGLPHATGIVERAVVLSGKALLGPEDGPVELAAGDYIRYPADRPHIYQAVDGPCRGVLLVEYEKGNR